MASAPVNLSLGMASAPVTLSKEDVACVVVSFNEKCVAANPKGVACHSLKPIIFALRSNSYTILNEMARCGIVHIIQSICIA